MLLQITTQCLEGCSHCMANATPDGIHMSEETFQASLELIKKLRPRNIQVTGGEPTLHPNFYSFCAQLCELDAIVILESNGSFIADPERTEKVKALTRKNILVQVRTHPIYYPNYKDIFTNKELRKITTLVFDDEINLIPFGRAVKNHQDKINWAFKPTCSNMFLLSRQVPTFSAIIQTMEAHSFFCKPLLAPTGRIHVGETSSCQELGSVWDSPELLYTSIRNKKPCGNCGLVKNIPTRAMRRIENGYPCTTGY